ncbi:MAG: bifunctional hydroxymethylpyrimidine kinase/phosphomethylpyrimidine kinase [Deltaproteobacteria bacterium]|nr:bifunctional hydroxymethylpyrimidine kinase/phosphomethylpyrimidine kinase [Deltaproteobacteria bacterium]
MIPKILTIAGSDSGGGAGIQADLKTITVLGGYGMSVLTALTAQNTVGVTGIHEVPPDFIAAQIDAVAEDIGVDAVKTGMLLTSHIVELVARKIREHGMPNLVVDPVMVAKSGDPLLVVEARNALKKHLVPLSRVITPNIPEAEILSGMTISTMAHVKEAARIIHGEGAENVVIKGGHRLDRPVDTLFDGSDFFLFEGEHYDTPNTHGTGCTFSAVIATGLGTGLSVEEAVAWAKEYIQLAIRYSLDIGEGHGPTNHLAPVLLEWDKSEAIEELEDAFERFEEMDAGYLIPEVQSSLVYALPHARSADDVAAFPGRIVRLYDGAAVLAPPEFGVSEYMAKVLLRIMKGFPEQRSAMNLRFLPRVIDRAEELGFSVEEIEVSLEEGGCSGAPLIRLLERMDRPPDLIYHRGAHGIEPQIILMAETPGQVMDLIEELDVRDSEDRAW